MPPQPERIQFVADRGDGRLRLDQSILRHLRDVTPRSRNRIQGWIDEGRVTVDGVEAHKSSARVRERAVVEVALPNLISAFAKEPHWLHDLGFYPSCHQPTGDKQQDDGFCTQHTNC